MVQVSIRDTRLRMVCFSLFSKYPLMFLEELAKVDKELSPFFDLYFAYVFPSCIPPTVGKPGLLDPFVDGVSRIFKADRMTAELIDQFDVEC
jgi:hypothetical protein